MHHDRLEIFWRRRALCLLGMHLSACTGGRHARVVDGVWAGGEFGWVVASDLGRVGSAAPAAARSTIKLPTSG